MFRPCDYFETEAVSAPTDAAPCGVTGRTEAERKRELTRLLDLAEEAGATDRKRGLEMVRRTTEGHYECTECKWKGRRDRTLAHVLGAHLRSKTWACPHWYVCFHPWSAIYPYELRGSGKGYRTKDNLSQHLQAKKVDCLWYVA
jgi:hypothetical protein